ncbi:MAG: laccase domain-containing protein [Bacteroidales bacterium]|nr:laccase domain-containing protein [Bacteroidales bacterium]
MTKFEVMFDGLLKYDLGAGVEAFSTQRDAVLPYEVTQGHQVHGSRVAIIKRSGMTREELEGYDAFITKLPGVAIGVRTADCVPILLYDPVKRVIAAVHAGWKGTVLHIAQGTIAAMAQVFKCNPADTKAVIGPGIGPDSFQVGEEVATQFKETGFPMDDIWSFRGAGDGTPIVLAGKNRAFFHFIFNIRLNGAFCPSRRGLPLRSFS